MVDVCLHFRLNCNCVICYGGIFLLCVYMTSTIHSRVAHVHVYVHVHVHVCIRAVGNTPHAVTLPQVVLKFTYLECHITSPQENLIADMSYVYFYYTKWFVSSLF